MNFEMISESLMKVNKLMADVQKEQKEIETIKSCELTDIKIAVGNIHKNLLGVLSEEQVEDIKETILAYATKNFAPKFNKLAKLEEIMKSIDDEDVKIKQEDKKKDTKEETKEELQEEKTHIEMTRENFEKIYKKGGNSLSVTARMMGVSKKELHSFCQKEGISLNRETP